MGPSILSFSNDHPVAEIKYSKNITKDAVMIEHCNLNPESMVFQAIVRALKERKEKYDEGAGCQWDGILISECAGRVDALIPPILACPMDKLTVDALPLNNSNGSGNADDKTVETYHDRIWSGLCQGLPPCKSLRGIEFENFVFTKERIGNLENAFRSHLAAGGSLPEIEHVFITSPKFADGGQGVLGSLIHHSFSSAFSKAHLQCGSMSDGEIAELIAPLLMGIQTSNEPVPSATSVEELDLESDCNISTKSMSVLAQWLRWKSASKESATQNTTSACRDDSPSPQFLGICRPDSRGVFEDDFIDALSESTLGEFRLFFWYADPQDFAKLTTALVKCHQRHLSSVNLNCCDLSNHSWAMASYLWSIEGSLLELRLRGCKLDDYFLTILSCTLRGGSRLKHLNLGGKQYFSEETIYDVFVDAVCENTELKHLEIVVRSVESRRLLRLMCDFNRGGRRFYWNKKNGTDNKNPVALWPLILHRACHSMALPHEILSFYHAVLPGVDCTKDCDEYCLLRGEDEEEIVYFDTEETRRATVLYDLLRNGIVPDCCNERPPPLLSPDVDAPDTVRSNGKSLCRQMAKKRRL